MDKIKEGLCSLVQKIKKEGLDSYETDVSKVTREVPINKSIVALNTSGCSYKKEGVGCFHCGHLKGYEHSERMFEQFLSDVERIEEKNKISIYSNGSFFDSREISEDSQKAILQHLKNLGFRQIVLETRPEHIKKERLEKLLNDLDKTELLVGLGFDTYSDKIRDLCLNKGFLREDYKNATRILADLNIQFESRIVIKPPFLTEREGIDEAIKSVRYAFDRGCEYISLEPIALQPHTLQDYLHKIGKYRAPWLWSILSIISETHNLGKINIGGENFYPIPYEVAHNCHNCDIRIKTVLKQFEKTQNIEDISEISCKCKKEWIYDLKKGAPNLYDRIERVLEKF